jgi:hypothetical protein
MNRWIASYVACAVLTGCDVLTPRVEDIAIDAPPGQARIDARLAPDDTQTLLLPAGTAVLGVGENPELLSQIRIFDGLSDSALATANGVLVRTAAKVNGATVKIWNFGSAQTDGNFVTSAPIYVLADSDGAGGFTPRADHPFLLDSIPGDSRYSAVRRIIFVPVTAMYQGELITSIEALDEALARGIVGEPVQAGTWRNIPVVPPGTKLELGGESPPMDAMPVFARGHIVDVFPIGGTLGIQPLRNGQIPSGQESRLLSGVAAGSPPTLPTAADATTVLQYGIPIEPPTTTFNYTPIVVALDVRLATGVAPAAITNDTALFKRSATGSITGYSVDNVATFTVTTTVSNKPLQFVEGSP